MDSCCRVDGTSSNGEGVDTGDNFGDGKCGNITEPGLGQASQDAGQESPFVDPSEGGVQVLGCFEPRNVNELLVGELLRAQHHRVHKPEGAPDDHVAVAFAELNALLVSFGCHDLGVRGAEWRLRDVNDVVRLDGITKEGLYAATANKVAIRPAEVTDVAEEHEADVERLRSRRRSSRWNHERQPK